jgi:DNA polymerase-3 subunit delta
MDAFTFLQKPAKQERQPIYVLFGDEPFLKRQALIKLRTLLLGAEENPFGWSALAGDKLAWSTVHSELTTLPFGSPCRVVVVDAADTFVTACRDKLEKYLAAPSKSGVLILDVKSWVATTKLAKLVPDKGTIVCKVANPRVLPGWCEQWCPVQHGKPISGAAARLLVDLVGADMGLLDQELAKLAVYVGDAKQIETGDVDKLVGNNRDQDLWKIFDLISSAQTAAALSALDRLLTQGEEPLRLLGAFAMKLRGVAQAYRLTTLGKSLNEAMDDVGIPSYPIARQSAEQQMRHLGGRRLNRIYDWLLETNQGMKGGSQLPPRTLMERLVIQLARK